MSGANINYRITPLIEIFQYPEPSFIIDPILVEGTVSILGAYTGQGKSLLALSIIKSILTGDPLWGKFPVLKTGPALLIDEETPHAFLRERIEKMGFEKNLPFYFLHFQDVRLDNKDCFEALMGKVEEINPVLVVIDSLIRVHGQKEDDATSMSRVIDRLRKIANLGTTLLVIHHHRKAEGPLSQMLRGSSDIPGGIDIQYALIPKDGYFLFSSVKTRTKPLDPIKLKMEINETRIEITCIGTEADEVVKEVLGILRSEGRPMSVNEIFGELKVRDCEVGINRLRIVLKGAVEKGIIQGGEEKSRGKRFLYWVGDSSLFTSIYNSMKREETSPFLHGEDTEKEISREELRE
jgi:hypothetical protein